MKHFVLLYELSGDYMARRATFRAEHLSKAWAASDRGELVLGGAVLEPVDTAILVFKGESKKVAEDFARTDPYVLNGLVARWQVREWATVVGGNAAAPVRP